MTQNLSVHDIIKYIDKRIDEIWSNPPSEIENLLEPRGPYGQSFTTVIYAYFDVYALANILWTLRQNAKAGVPIGSLATVTESILNNHAVSLEAYGLADTAKFLRKISLSLLQVRDSKEYVMMTEKLMVYLNRLGMAGWLDLIVPWQMLSCAFEEGRQARRLGLGKSDAIER
jgi:hypothetical protein